MGRYRINPRDLPVYTDDELRTMIEQKISRIRDRGLISFLYLTASRASEVLKVTRKDVTQYYSPQHNLVVHMASIPVLKRKDAHVRKIILDFTSPLLELFLDYLEFYDSHLSCKPLFCVTNRGTVHRIVDQLSEPHDPFTPHRLRHIRASNLVNIKRFRAFQLKEYVGWSTIKSAETYYHLPLSDQVSILMGENNER